MSKNSTQKTTSALQNVSVSSKTTTTEKWEGRFSHFKRYQCNYYYINSLCTLVNF